MMPATAKLGAPGRRQLEQLREAGATPAQRVSMFLRGAAVFTPEQLELLKQDGASIRTRAGQVVTIDVPLDAVERVLDHDFVIASELSAPLYLEHGGDSSVDSK
jgi:hypothetical protein